MKSSLQLQTDKHSFFLKKKANGSIMATTTYYRLGLTATLDKTRIEYYIPSNRYALLTVIEDVRIIITHTGAI